MIRALTLALLFALSGAGAHADDRALRDALATACGRPISGIRAVIADHAMPEPPPGRPAPPGPPRPEAVDAAEGLAATINDPDLRAVVARAAAMAFERRWTP